MKKTRVLFSALSLSLAMTMAFSNVYALEKDEQDVADKVVETTSNETNESVTPEVTNDSVVSSINVKLHSEGYLDTFNVMVVGATKLPRSARLELLDENGNLINTVPLTVDMIKGFDSSTEGEKEYTVSYEGVETKFTINFRPLTLVTASVTEHFLSVPIGANLSKYAIGFGFKDVGNENLYPGGSGPHALNSDIFYGTKPADLIDPLKAGTQVITFSVFSEEYGGVINGTLHVAVGEPTQKPAEELLSEEAINTMPSGEVVGTWEVPSGENGAGTWVFQTKQAHGTGVTVYTYHDGQWLTIGKYNVASDGTVTVSFTADQLSPVLIVKNGENIDPNEPTDKPTDKPSGEEEKPSDKNDNSSKKDEAKKNKDTVKTGVENNTTMMVTLLSFACIGALSLIILIKHKNLADRF